LDGKASRSNEGRIAVIEKRVLCGLDSGIDRVRVSIRGVERERYGDRKAQEKEFSRRGGLSK